MIVAPRLRAAAAFAGCGGLAALLNTAGDLTSQPYWVRGVGPLEVFLRFLPPWLIAAGLGFGLRELIVRHAFGIGRSRVRTVAAHLAGVAVFPLAQLFLLAMAHRVVDGATPYSILDNFLGLLPRYYLLGVVTYAAAAAVLHAVEYAREARERERRELALEASLADARLAALRHQLSPHFLFNALNTVGMLVRQDRPAEALDTLARFGDLMRDVLDAPGGHEVPLGQELAFIRRYLEIEQVRFHDRLTVQVGHDPGLEDVPVPHLILQPLVENAVRHGVSPRPGPGRIAVEVRARNGGLVLGVTDDGVGFPEGGDAEAHYGIGLSNTRDRLAELYRSAGRLEVIALPEGGVRAEVTVPLRRRPA